MQERIQKILSARGIASRRKAEEYIKQGLVLVNGEPAVLGQKADPEVDSIEVKGEVVEARKEMLYYVMNKPRGVVTTNVVPHPPAPGTKRSPRAEKEGVPTVRDLLPENLRGKIYPIGRLDKDSEGLLLFTNDGVLAYRLTHPKFDHEKEYEVTTERPMTGGQVEKLEEGMKIAGEKLKPAVVKKFAGAKMSIVLTEGRNRQIRRMCQKVGNPVKTLKRVRIMTLTDPLLKEGRIRLLTAQEKTALLASVGL
jgi:23S rRNA pseudouridine2605 synthase/23S rRNA pseudouridine2604 synthase